MDELAAGTRLGNYRIERLLGGGGTSRVYASTNVASNTPVALEVLAPHLARDPALAERFVREGRAAARVRHAHAVEVLDVGVIEVGLVEGVPPVPYVAMELLEGEPLAKRFARGPLPPLELASLMLPVIAAVAAAHEVSVIHRALHPNNVFLRRDAPGRVQPIVLDFGMSDLASEVFPPPADAPAAPGTFYLSPEQARGAKNATGATDQYALGVLMYVGATGRRPFEGRSRGEVLEKIDSGVFRRPDLVDPALPKALADAIVRAMSLEARARYTSLWAMGASFLPVADPQAQATWRETFERRTGGRPATRTTSRSARISTVIDGASGGFDGGARARTRRMALIGGLAVVLGLASLAALRAHSSHAAPKSALAASTSATDR